MPPTGIPIVTDKSFKAGDSGGVGAFLAVRLTSDGVKVLATAAENGALIEGVTLHPVYTQNDDVVIRRAGGVRCVAKEAIAIGDECAALGTTTAADKGKVQKASTVFAAGVKANLIGKAITTGTGDNDLFWIELNIRVTEMP